MLTIHGAELLLPGGGLPAVPDGAVAVRGREIVATGPAADVAAACPGARVRRWPGVLTPGLVHPYGVLLLELAYHPDPREADELGTEPLTGDALAALAMDDTRWGASARRGAQRLLAHGVTAIAGTPRRAVVADAVARTGLTVLPGGTRPAPDTWSFRAPAAAYAAVLDGRAVGERADLAVFDGTGDGAVCLATVLAGRLVHRRR
ncbi:hypothetical protein [Streptomyces qinzhouensis]|uniref:Amidohydrolase family protein n=1 Tax=Streptomyces qinzhouensis TaxID=2599401 RepID=A0A5B8ILP1_9ACTN|nr:hypothetical protein [Streptomyces qinzhouensis]QDY78419.1 hypothetical protein FQU76_20120 [Streptomyces qinzhouensis]